MSTDSQKIAEMQTAIASLNATVATLLTEVARLSAPQSRPVMKTSIPLMPTQPAHVYGNHMVKKGRRPYGELRQSANIEMEKPKQEHTPIPLSAVLQTNEEVTFFVYAGKDANGQMIRTTAVSTFDGTHLLVKKCELVPSLVGTQTQKPGEILYRFIEELKNGGHIKRTFSVAPWKLCFVKRDGAEVTLDQLRANLSQSE